MPRHTAMAAPLVAGHLPKCRGHPHCTRAPRFAFPGLRGTAPARRGTWSCARHRLDGMISVSAYAGGGGAEQQEIKPEPAAVEPAPARRGGSPRVRRYKAWECVPKKKRKASTGKTTTIATVGFLKVEPTEERSSSSTNHGEPDVVRVAATAEGVGERAASRVAGLLLAARRGSKSARSTSDGGGSEMAGTHEQAHADESNVIPRGATSIRRRDDSEADPRGEEEHGAAAADNAQGLPPRKGGAKLEVARVRTDDDGAGVERRPSERCKATDDVAQNASCGFPRSSSDVCSKHRRTLRLNPDRQRLLPNRTCGAPRAVEAVGEDNSGGGGGGVSRDRVLGKRCAGGRVAVQGAVDNSERRPARKKAKRTDVGTSGDVDGGGGGGVGCDQPVSEKEVNVLGVPNPGGWGEGGAEKHGGWRFPTVVFDGECFQDAAALWCHQDSPDTLEMPTKPPPPVVAVKPECAPANATVLRASEHRSTSRDDPRCVSTAAGRTPTCPSGDGSGDMAGSVDVKPDLRALRRAERQRRSRQQQQQQQQLGQESQRGKKRAATAEGERSERLERATADNGSADRVLGAEAGLRDKGHDPKRVRCSYKACRQPPVVGVYGLGGEETEFCRAHSVQGMQALVRGLPTG